MEHSLQSAANIFMKLFKQFLSIWSTKIG